MKQVYHAIPDDMVIIRKSDLIELVKLAEELGRRYWGEAGDPLWLARPRTQLNAQEATHGD